MLVYGQEILNKANKEKYGVGAFNFVNFEMLNAIFVAAHQARSPIFVQASEGAIKYMGIDMAVGMVKTMSKRYPHIPVALHLDHGTSFESCKKAVEAGFTSVMIDASHYQFNENLEETSKVVKMAHEHGVGVEAELGRLMGIEDNISVSEKEAVLVNPQEAEQFVRESKVDYLAPAIGTSHGAFKFKGEPKLDFERIVKIAELTKLPLVMHGGSGVSKENYLKAIDCGIRKINYYSYAGKAGVDATREFLNTDPTFYHEIACNAKNVMKENIKEAMKVFNKISN